MGGISVYCLQETIQTDTQRRLAAVAALKVSQIQTWLDKRRKNLDVLAQNPIFVAQLQAVLARFARPERAKPV